MIAVIFEAMPHEGQWDAYLEIAASLRPKLELIDGFISLERFESLSVPGKVLALSFWRDEEAVAQWRSLTAHRKAQAVGRASIFRDYRLRVGAIVRDYGAHDRSGAPEDSRQLHDRNNQ